MPSLHPLLVLTSPPEALSQGPTGLSIRNVAVALKERFLIFTACTNQRCCRPCICLWRGCSFRCTSEYEKKKLRPSHDRLGWVHRPWPSGRFHYLYQGGARSVGSCMQKGGREMKFRILLGLPPFAVEQVCTARRAVADYWQVVFPPPPLLKFCCSFQVCP